MEDFDIDEMLALEEAQKFDDEYADDFEALNDIEHGAVVTPEIPSVPPPNQSSRKLFPSNDSSTIVEDELENDLIIAEEDEITLVKKRFREDDEGDNIDMPQSKKPSMPTTLDHDRDETLRKKKIEQEKGFGSPELINKILRRRQRNNKKSNSSEIFEDANDSGSSVNKPLTLTKVLLHPPHCDYMPATSTDGKRVYMRMKDNKNRTANNIAATSPSGSLLTENIAKLRQKVQNQKLKLLYQESMRITDEVRKNANIISESQEIHALSKLIDLNSGVSDAAQILAMDTSMEQSEIEQHAKDSNQDGNSEQGLWLNKYAPTQYTHLLSDETVNRALLKWLKMWDPVVFNREYKPRKDPTKKENEHRNNFQNKFKKFNILEHIDDKVDEYKRPIWKAALLCGAPGLGKTTLAHIIVKHAGYHVVEMNASDDRSAQAFSNKLEETTEMTSVLAHDGRPNCLIIDEIDGAPVAAINVLLNAMNRGREKKKTKSGKVKQKDRGGILLRPIICICNDLYTPALRQLRQQSLVLHFPPTLSATLAVRLSQLCRLQSLDCDTTTLLTLCEKAENDIRSCINTLQFIRTQGTKKLNLSSIKAMEIGQKDQHKSIFTIWNEIFQLPKNKRKMERDSETIKMDSRLSNKKLSQFSTRFYTVLQLVSANGDYEKTLQGVYENFLLMKFKDPDMSGLQKAYQWLQTYDKINNIVRSLQEWSLFRYIPFMFVLFHFLFACVAVPRIQYPTARAEANKKRQQTESLLEMMISDMVPGVRCFASRSKLVLDVIPYLLSIMSPQIRPINVQLFNNLERNQMSDLVQTMLLYNLTYRQQRNEDGQYVYVLEPDMSETCRFPGTQNHFQLSYATKQMISKEVELEKMRKSEHIMDSNSKKENVAPIRKEKQTVAKNISTPAKDGKPLPNHLQRLEDKIANTQIGKEKPVMDFFSRFKKVKKIKTDSNGEEIQKKALPKDPGIGNSQIWYKYHAGFSNAVRRTIFVKEFL